jgi:hypothetical protein
MVLDAQFIVSGYAGGVEVRVYLVIGKAVGVVRGVGGVRRWRNLPIAGVY